MFQTAAIRRVSPDPPDAPTDAPSARPVRADVTTTATVGGALVAVTLRNDTAVAVRVRVENDLDGPVLPPRREGVPAAGWDEDGFTGVVPADARLGIGYACPNVDGDTAGPADTDRDPGAHPDRALDPISLAVLGPAEEADPSASDRVAVAVRSLGRATPPADAVPTSAALDPDRTDSSAGCRPRRCDGPAESDPSSVPTPVAAWLDAVETRVRRAERLTDATADEAAAVLEDCGGVDGVATLPDELQADRASLRAAGDRIEDLAARAAEADPELVVSSLLAAAEGDTSPASGGESTASGTSGAGDPEAGR